MKNLYKALLFITILALSFFVLNAALAAECSDGIDNDQDGGIDALVEIDPHNGQTIDIPAHNLEGNSPGWVTYEVNEQIARKKFPYTQPNRLENEHFLRTDGGWSADYAHMPTLNKVCYILGYREVQSHECSSIWADSCTFHTPSDNYLWRFDGTDFKRESAEPKEKKSWISRIVCIHRYSACSDGWDNDGDGFIDYPNDLGCFSPNDDSEIPHDTYCAKLDDPYESPFGNSPTASFSCSLADCQTHFDQTLNLINESYDPDGVENIRKSEWYVKIPGYGNFKKKKSCFNLFQGQNIAICDWEIKNLSPGIYYVLLRVEDWDGNSDEYLNVITIKAKPPQVETKPAWNVEEHSAFLRGQLNNLGGGNSVNVWFKYDLEHRENCDQYGREILHNIKDTTGGFGQGLTGLLPNTTYYYRAAAENIGGIVCGDEMSFTTKKDDPSGNNPPIANAGSAKIIDETKQAELNGSKSSDPEGAIAVWAWSCNYNGEPYGDIANSNASTTTFIAPKISQDSIDVICVLEIFDADGLSDTDDVVVRIKNIPPIAETKNINPDLVSDRQAVLEGELTKIGGDGFARLGFNYGKQESGICSFDNPSIIAYENASSEQNFHSVVFGLEPDTVYCFKAYAKDDGEAVNGEEKIFKTKTFSVNAPPIADVENTEVEEGRTRELDGSKSYDLEDGDDITFSWACDKGQLLGINSAKPKYTAPMIEQPMAEKPFDMDRCTLTVKDTKELVSSKTIEILILNTIDSPQVRTVGADADEHNVDLEGKIESLGGANSVNVWFKWSRESRSDCNSYTEDDPPKTPSQEKYGKNKFYQEINGLASSTTYYFRAFAENSAGIVCGDEMSFTTDFDPSQSQDPTAVIKGPDEINEKESIELDGSESNDPDGEIVGWGWNCTDGDIALDLSNLKKATYIAPQISKDLSGNDSVVCTLEVRSNDGGIGEVEHSITVKNIPPKVETKDADQIYATGANLNGELTKIGGDGFADLWFEWGKTVSYGSSYGWERKDNTSPFWQSISGLEPGTEYHFRIVAEDDGEPVFGEDKVFTTSLSQNVCPVADIECSVSSCVQVSDNLVIFNNSTDQNSTDLNKTNDIENSFWYIDNVKIDDATCNGVCNFTPGNYVFSGEHNVKLIVTDGECDDDESVLFQIIEGPNVEFKCSLKKAGPWEQCENINPTLNQKVYLNPGYSSSPFSIDFYNWLSSDNSGFDDEDNGIYSFSPSNYLTTVTLTITDSAGRSASASHIIRAISAPRWQEIPPFSWLEKTLSTVSNFLIY